MARSCVNSLRLNDELRDTITKRLDAFQRTVEHDSSLVPASVALTLVNENAEKNGCFLLTRRSQHIKRHRSQYALPGGCLDPGETIVDAALRELHEELGINASPHDVLGILDDYRTRSGFNISPVVVWVGDCESVCPDPAEVETVFRVKLHELLDPEAPVLEPATEGGHTILSIPLKAIGHRIYAPTAAILYQFREVALLGKGTRVAHFDQPRFAWH